MLRIKTRGVRSFSRSINSQAQVIVDQAMSDMVSQSVAEAKANSPIDTGKNASLIKGSTRPKLNGVVGEVVAGAEYAAYIEFGTGTYVRVSPDYKEFAAQFKGSQDPNAPMQARPHILPAIRKAFNKLVFRIEKISEL